MPFTCDDLLEEEKNIWATRQAAEEIGEGSPEHGTVVGRMYGVFRGALESTMEGKNNKNHEKLVETFRPIPPSVRKRSSKTK